MLKHGVVDPVRIGVAGLEQASWKSAGRQVAMVREWRSAARGAAQPADAGEEAADLLGVAGVGGAVGLEQVRLLDHADLELQREQRGGDADDDRDNEADAGYPLSRPWSPAETMRAARSRAACSIDCLAPVRASGRDLGR